jgi:hypothetical protein
MLADHPLSLILVSNELPHNATADEQTGPPGSNGMDAPTL